LFEIDLIPHSRPLLGETEALSAAEVIRSGNVAQGDRVRAFEGMVCGTFGFADAAATSSGTAALHLALLALGVGPGDEVIIPSFVCSALLNAVRHAGGVPVLADVDPDTGNMDPGDARKRRTSKTRAIILPHLFGRPAEMPAIIDLGIPVIEDCAQAIGATIDGKPVGTFGSLAVYSFYATKVITTGEGGMVAGDPVLVSRVRHFREYDNRMEGRLSFNYKMTDIQAAIGVAQLKRLTEFVTRRQKIAKDYDFVLESSGLATPPPVSGNIYFRYPVLLAGEPMRDRWIERMKERGIACARPVFRPLHHLTGENGFPGAESAWRRMLSIPLYPALTDGEVRCITMAIKEINGEAGK